MARITFNGESGDVFTNETGKAQFQFVASLQNTCGVCLQYHHAVGPWWPIPMHRGCRCHQTLVAPGQQAAPFVDFRRVLADLPPDQQVKAVGASNYKLIQAGVVKWDDVATKARVRTLREVASIKKLPVQAMIRAGVPTSIARDAHAAVNTPAHQIAAEARKALVDKLKDAGLSASEVREAVSRRVVNRLAITPVTAAPVKQIAEFVPILPFRTAELERLLAIRLTQPAAEAAAKEREALLMSLKPEVQVLVIVMELAKAPPVDPDAVRRILAHLDADFVEQQIERLRRKVWFKAKAE